MQYNKEILTDLYVNQQLSWQEIAKKFNTYPNKVRRDATKLGIQSRTKGEAQSLALKTERHKHPTKGTKRSETLKQQIGDKVSQSWSQLSVQQKHERQNQARECYNNKTFDQKQALHQAALKGVQKAAREGSKLEKYLYNELIKAGYHVEYHKQHLILNEKLHLDLFLPKLNVVIEIDGPTHSQNIFGEKILQQTKKTDNEKSGLVLAKGMVFIRIKSPQNMSAKRQRDIFKNLLTVLYTISQKYPSRNNRYITLGV